MTLTVPIGVVGLVVSIASASAGDFNADVDFVRRASTGDLFAIAESQLALVRASDPRVRAFARRMVDDHKKAEAALQVAADGSGAAVSKSLDRDRQARVTALQRKSGKDFDKAYVADQVEEHSNALTFYADYMLLGANDTIKALAIKMIPIAQAELNEVEALPGN